jgi:hypothetical protein
MTTESSEQENVTPPPWIPFYIPSQGWAACWKGPQTNGGVGPDRDLYPICHMRWTDGMVPKITERLENEVRLICDAVNSYADSQKKIEVLKTALRAIEKCSHKNAPKVATKIPGCSGCIARAALAETER